MNIIEILQSIGNVVFINLLIQITVLCSLALVIAQRFMNSAAVRYNILFPAMVSLLLLVTFSVVLQLSGKNLILVPLQERASLAVSDSTPNFIMDELSLEELTLYPAIDILNQGAGNDDTAAAPQSGLASFSVLLLSLPPYLIALIVWLGGFLFLTIGLLRSCHHVEHISRRSRPLKDDERRYLGSLMATHLSDGIELHFRVSDRIASPMLVGISKPCILLPGQFITQLNGPQLRSVLLHELAHYQRNDGLANFIQRVLLAIFWFHPLVHVMDRWVSRAREEICDNYVINSELPVNYGEALLQVGVFSASQERSTVSLQAAVGVLGNSWNLESRINDLLSERRDRTVRLNSRAKRAIQFSIVGLSLLLAACQLGNAPSQAPQNQALVLEERAQRLLEERQQIEVETRELQNQLRNLRAQLDRREQSEQDAALTREAMLRSIAELQSVFMVEQNETHFQDISQFTKRLLEEMLRQDQAQVMLNQRATQSMREILLAIENNELDFNSLRSRVYRLDALIAAPAEADSVATTGRTRRPAPRARDGEVLSESVVKAISEIQALMSPEDESVESDLASAKVKLDELRESRFEDMNVFEKSTLLSFYTNYYLSLDDYAGAINSFEEVLGIGTLRQDIRLRTLRSLGQLYAAEEQWRQSIDRYSEWRDVSLEENAVVFRGLSYAHYQLEQFDEALPNWIAYMDMLRAEGAELDREDYSYLNGLYYTLDDYESALEVTKDMILLFNHPTDWNNLRAIYRALDEDGAAMDNREPVGAAAIEITGGPETEQATFTLTDGDYLPLVAIAPQYPTRAAQRGIEGWVLVAFTVDGKGDVIPDSISVVDADPPNIFNRSAIRATARFKFQPRVQDGEGVDVPGVQYLFRWALENDDVQV